MKNYFLFQAGAFKFRQAIIICLFAFGINSLFAQSSKVVNLAFEGKSATFVKGSVLPPGGGNNSQINVNDIITSGTKLIIPSNTMVVLQSPKGKQVLKSTQPNINVEYSVTFNGQTEIHTINGLGGEITSTVSKLAGYNYKVNNGKGTTASARGTEFTFTDNSGSGNEQANISTSEGSINIIDQVPVSIGGAAPKVNKYGVSMTKSVSTEQSAGQQEFTSSNQPVYYDNYDEAILALYGEVGSSYSDPDERADDLTCLGDLYMYNEQPQQAISYYDQAVKIYMQEYGDDDIWTLEAKLALADAYKQSGQSQQAYQIVDPVKNILTDFKDWDLEDLQYVRDYEFGEGADLICEDLIDVYGLLSWAYEILGNYDESNNYFNKMLNPCQ